jgi:hypothetical protein
MLFCCDWDAYVMLLAKVHQEVEHGHAQGGIDHAGRLSGDEQFGADDQRLRDYNALHLPTRELVRPLVQRVHRVKAFFSTRLQATR